MNILNKKEFMDLMNQYPNGGIVFFEGDLDSEGDVLLVTDGDFGATMVAPFGEVSDEDWNIKEFEDSQVFTVFDNNDVLQMIQTLTRGLKIPLKYME